MRYWDTFDYRDRTSITQPSFNTLLSSIEEDAQKRYLGGY